MSSELRATWVAVCLVIFATGGVVSHAQTLERTAIDTVADLVPGRIQNTGQGPAFFPANLFGVPDPRATDTTPSTDPREICSIGVGGQIVVGFADHAVVDAPGPDLIIFENAFRYGAGKLYAEPARVEVSRDGVVWTAFPYDSLSLLGCAGVTPTTGDDPFDPQVYLAQIATERPSFTIAPPAVLNMLLQNEALLSKVDLTSLRTIGSGSAPLAPAMVAGYQERLNLPVINIFGSNEGMSLITGADEVPAPVERDSYFPGSLDVVP